MKETADRVQLSDVCLYRQGAAAAASATGEASHVATMRTIRQVKTVFLIFIAFVSCWTPYIVVVLYDTSDTLPLPVHLYRQRRPPSVRLQRGRTTLRGFGRSLVYVHVGAPACQPQFRHLRPDEPSINPRRVMMTFE